MLRAMTNRIRMALIGGGFIGRVHARAARLDGRFELVAGVLSEDRAKSARVGQELGIAPERVYEDYRALLAAEQERRDGARLIVIATPNDTHHPIAHACLAAGLPVVLEKPLTLTLQEAQDLAEAQATTGAPLALMHNYTGYPLVRQIRSMVAEGEIGKVLAVRAVYLQGSAWRLPDPGGQVRAAWRFDPRRMGASGCFADIGTHAYNLLRYVTQVPVRQLSCSLATYTPGRQLDDYGTATLSLDNGALATVIASKVSHGRENDISIHVDGTKGSLEWRQEEPNQLVHRATGEARRVLTRDPRAAWLHPDAKAAIRLPAGHPEAFNEAFANVYAAFLPDIEAFHAKMPVPPPPHLYPDLEDGVDGMRFVDACVRSSKEGGRWTRV